MKWKLHLLIFISIFFLFFYYISSYKNIYFIEYDIKVIQNDSSYLGELYYSDNSPYNPENRRQIRYFQAQSDFYAHNRKDKRYENYTASKGGSFTKKWTCRG